MSQEQSDSNPPQPEPPSTAPDPAWLERIAHGLDQFYWLVFACVIQSYVFGLLLPPPWGNWLDVLAVAAALIPVWLLTTPRPGQPPEDPQAWPQRGARAMAIVALLAKLYPRFDSIFDRWYLYRIWYSRISIVFFVSLALCILLTSIVLSRIARQLSLKRIGTALAALGWFATLTFVLMKTPYAFSFPESWNYAVAVVFGITSPIHALTWLCLLLLAGRLQEVIRLRRDAPVQPPASQLSANLLPKKRLTWGIVLAALLLLTVYPPWGFFAKYAAMAYKIGFATGIFLIARSLPIATWARLVMYINAAILAVEAVQFGQLSAALREAPPVLLYVIASALFLSLLICFGSPFLALHWASRSRDDRDLAAALGSRAYVVMFFFLLRFVVSLIVPRRLELGGWNVFYLVEAVVLLVVIESIVILGRAWQAAEARPVPAAHEQPA